MTPTPAQLRTLAGVVGLALASSASAVTTFDFESLAATGPVGTLTHLGALTTLSTTVGGETLTLTRANRVAFDVIDNTGRSAPAAFGLRSLDPFSSRTADGFIGNLSAPVTSVTLDYGDYGVDADTLTLNAYAGPNGTGTLLATKTDNYGLSEYPTFDTVTVSAVGIQSFTVNGTTDTPSNGPNSVFLDNVVLGTTTVPEPAAAGLLGRRRGRA